MNSTFTKILRIILGLGLLFLGISHLIGYRFLPMYIYAGDTAVIYEKLSELGYILKIVGILEIFIGLMLILGKWVPFALLLLAPISVNILLYHLFLDAPGLIIALILIALTFVLIYKHWKVYRPLFH
ncbi:DoxX protein [Aequorivita sp. H23M31]|uniref:DoxX protein n=1 Tax=Aequorivita ciconiae TaxID=2494375 RepID=A0A410G5B7_9FLAO|nr:DoxX protein [Aequorivita sp. H23M31]QAA82449.1 DoxX protein [Aequorivita sp. H23M31]